VEVVIVTILVLGSVELVVAVVVGSVTVVVVVVADDFLDENIVALVVGSVGEVMVRDPIGLGQDYAGADRREPRCYLRSTGVAATRACLLEWQELGG